MQAYSEGEGLWIFNKIYYNYLYSIMVLHVFQWLEMSKGILLAFGDTPQETTYHYLLGRYWMTDSD